MEDVKVEEKAAADDVVAFREAFARTVWPKIGEATSDFVQAWDAEYPDANVDGVEIIVGQQLLIGHLVNQLVSDELKPYVIRMLVNGLIKQTKVSVDEPTTTH